MGDIDRDSPVPLYHQLRLLLQDQIERGRWQPGDQIPTEAELCERYGISRTPVRQALDALARAGVLTRTVGRGTFVAHRPEERVTLRVVVPDRRWEWPLTEAMRHCNGLHARRRLALQFETVPLSELHDYLSLAVARGKAPDVSVLDSVWVAEFAHRRYLCPLGDIDPAWSETTSSDFYPSLLSFNSYRGEQYAVPTNADVAVLWYRRDWLEAEGLAPPATWAQLLEVASHFCAPAVRRHYGLGAHALTFAAGRTAGETTTYQLLPFLRSNGSELIAGDRVVLDKAATREALRFLSDLVSEQGVVSPAVTEQPWNGTWRAFARGEVALAFGGTYEHYLIRAEAGWDTAAFEKSVGFLPLPAGPRGRTATLVGGMTYGIYRQTEQAKEALALLALSLSPAILKPFSLKTGQNPASISVAEAIGPDEDQFLRRTSQLLTDAGSRPSLPGYDRVSAQFQEMVELSLKGVLSVEAAVRRAAERIGGITGLPVDAAQE